VVQYVLKAGNLIFNPQGRNPTLQQRERNYERTTNSKPTTSDQPDRP